MKELLLANSVTKVASMALAGWDPNKKFRLEIDYSKIDSTLVDFPIMIDLGSESGNNSFDAAPLFDELQDSGYKKIAIEYGDTGEQCFVEVDRWLYNNTPSEYTYMGNRGIAERCSASSIYSTSYYPLEAWNGGVVSPDSDRWLSATGSFNGTTGAGTTTTWYQWDFKNENQIRNVTAIRYYCGTLNDSGPKDVDFKMSDTGEFTGEETFIMSYTWELGGNNAWNTLATFSGATVNKRYFRIYINTIFPTNNGYAGVSNWELTFQPTQTYAATLWTKVPSISFSEITTLYLYYDSLQEDNTQYVYTTAEVGTAIRGAYTTAKGTTEASEATQCKRIVIATSNLTTFSGTGKVRVLFEAHTTGYSISSCYIGTAADSGDAYDFASTPTAVTFQGGSSGTSVESLRAVYSDWVSHTVDSAKNLIVSFYHEAGTMWYKTAPAGITAYYKETIDESSSVDVTGYSSGNLTCLVSIEEKPQSPITMVWDDNYYGVYHTSQIPNITLVDSSSNNLNAAAVGMAATNYVTGPTINTRAIIYDTTSTYHQTNNSLTICGSNPRTVEYLYGTYKTTTGGVFRYGTGATNQRCAVIHNSAETHRADYYTNYEEFSAEDGDHSGDFVHFTYALDGTTVENSRLFKNGTELAQLGVTGGTNTVNTTYTQLYIGKTVVPASEYPAEGVVFEFRVSRTVRSPAWIKASYYSSMNQLVSIEEYHLFELNGYVQVSGEPVVRTVYLYDRENGRLIDSTTSSGVDGKFSLYTSTSGTVFINIMPEVSDSYNIIAQDKITPVQLI